MGDVVAAALSAKNTLIIFYITANCGQARPEEIQAVFPTTSTNDYGPEQRFINSKQNRGNPRTTNVHPIRSQVNMIRMVGTESCSKSVEAWFNKIVGLWLATWRFA